MSLTGGTVWAWAALLFAGLGACAWALSRWSGRADTVFVRRYVLQGVLVAGALLPAWLGPWPFVVSLAAASWLCTLEVERALASQHAVARTVRRLGGLGFSVVMAWIAWSSLVIPSAWLLSAGCLALGWPWLFLRTSALRRAWLALHTAWAWPALSLLALSSLSARPSLFVDMAFLYGVLEVNDSAAFVVGRSLGRHRFAPRLSPNKTWEGVLAGLLGAAGTGLALAFCQPTHAPLTCALLGLGLGCAGTCADLSASALKRAVEVKDYGTSLGPHGGWFDAYDSLILVGPFWCAFVGWF